MDSERKDIGYIVGGGLKENLSARITLSTNQVQEVTEGSFVLIKSGNWHFYGLVTDVQLGTTNPRFADEKGGERIPSHLSKLLHGQTLYTNVEIFTALMMEVGPGETDPAFIEWERKRIESGVEPHPIPVKTVPSHHAEVFTASHGDIDEIFGKDQEGKFVIGYTRDQQKHPVRIDLDKFVQRSSGIFGATGTGKSFLTRIVLAGLMHYNHVSLLVFDMHNEYAYTYISPESGHTAAGLKEKFGAKTRVVGLGTGAEATYQGHPPDINLEIAMRDIDPGDIELLARELNLRETTPTTLAALVRHFGKDKWFSAFKNMTQDTIIDENGKRIPAPGSVAEWANENSVHPLAAEGLHRNLKRVFDKKYIVENPAGNGVAQITDALENGRHIILSFGNYDNDLDYLLVSNILTRHIRQAWEKKTNEYHRDRLRNPRPKPLVIVVEEAHKLLNQEMATQTIFSTIARELRKYFVTLLIIDQRPSQIYDEVMSQLGTRISGWLGDDDDIQAVLSGLAGRETLRGMLARLESGEEILLLGPWGVKMPLPVRSRRYNDEFWGELLGSKGTKSAETATREDELMRDIGF